MVKMPQNQTKPNSLSYPIKFFTHLWKYVYETISNSLHMFSICGNTFLQSLTDDLKNMNIFIRKVELIERRQPEEGTKHIMTRMVNRQRP